MRSTAATVAEYLRELPEERRAAISQIRAVIRKHLPKGYVEQMCYGMIGYVVPHRLYPAGYHCDPKQPLMFASLASQKNYMTFYAMTLYMGPGKEAWLRGQFAARGKKLDSGKCCVRFKKVDDLPLDVIGEIVAQTTVADYITSYEDARKRAKRSA
jgi:uncharacterized protein YdhG (YjbR/CyaY superfamily)